MFMSERSNLINFLVKIRKLPPISAAVLPISAGVPPISAAVPPYLQLYPHICRGNGLNVTSTIRNGNRWPSLSLLAIRQPAPPNPHCIHACFWANSGSINSAVRPRFTHSNDDHMHTTRVHIRCFQRARTQVPIFSLWYFCWICIFWFGFIRVLFSLAVFIKGKWKVSNLKRKRSKTLP